MRLLRFSVQDAQTPRIEKPVKIWEKIVVERRRSLTEGWTALASRPQAASMALLLLCLAVYLPGFVRLPAVDRTEAIYAETTRDMVARGDWTDPRFGTVVHQYRPIGTFWAQGVSRWLAGEAHALGIPPSSLTFHLQQLSHAGLVTQRRVSRQVIYATDFTAMNQVMGYLTENCCGAGACAPACSPAAVTTPKSKRKSA